MPMDKKIAPDNPLQALQKALFLHELFDSARIAAAQKTTQTTSAVFAEDPELSTLAWRLMGVGHGTTRSRNLPRNISADLAKRIRTAAGLSLLKMETFAFHQDQGGRYWRSYEKGEYSMHPAAALRLLDALALDWPAEKKYLQRFEAATRAWKVVRRRKNSTSIINFTELDRQAV